MKPIEKLLSEAFREGVKLRLDTGELRYEIPDGASALTSELRERVHEAARFLAEVRAVSRIPPTPIPPARRDRDLPLAVAQEGFWTLERLVPGNPFSNLTSALRIQGRLRVDILQWVFDEILRRHEILRTTFVTRGGQPVQVIAPAHSLPLAVEDLSELPAAYRKTEFFARAVREFRRPFDFAAGSLVRATLFRMAEDEHLLLETVHHIISDSWSLRLLNREVALLYQAFSTGDPSPLPDPALQYADFAAWQRESLAGAKLKAQRFYWKQKLQGGSLPPQELPTDFPRPPGQSFRTSSQTLVLPAALSRGLLDLGSQEGCTLFMMLLSTFVILLQRFSGQEEVRVGTVVAERNHPQIEGLIGLFINTLLLRTDLSGDPVLRVIVQRVREVLLEAYDHQELPFELLVQELERESGLERPSLFRAMFLFEGSAPAAASLGELRFEVLDLKELVKTDVTVTTFDLIFTFYVKAEGVTGSLVYKTSLFSPLTIRQMLDYFQYVAEEILAEPERPLSALRPYPRAAAQPEEELRIP